MHPHFQLTLRRAEAVREMAGLGQSKKRIAALLGVSRSRISQMCADFGIKTDERPGKTISNITIRRKWALVEMASLGQSQIQAAILLDIDAVRVSQLCKQFSIKMRNGRNAKQGWLKTLVLRDFGKPGMTASVMVERYACHPKAVDVTIHRLRKEGKLPPVQERC